MSSLQQACNTPYIGGVALRFATALRNSVAGVAAIQRKVKA